MYPHHARTCFRAILLTLAISASVPVARAQMVAIEEDTGDLYLVSATDASLSLIGDTGLKNLGALEFNPHDGTLYALTVGESPSLYEFQISSGFDDVTVVSRGELGIPFVFEGGLAFAPDGTAYGLNAGATIPLLFSIDLGTGDGTIVTALDGRYDIAGLGWRSDGLLIGLDSTDQVLLAIDPNTGATSEIEDMAPAIGSMGGMILFGDEGYFATAGPLALTPGSNELWSFDPFTGEHGRIGDFDSEITGAGFSGLAIVPEPTTVGLLAVGFLSLLRRRRKNGAT